MAWEAGQCWIPKDHQEAPKGLENRLSDKVLLKLGMELNLMSNSRWRSQLFSKKRCQVKDCKPKVHSARLKTIRLSLANKEFLGSKQKIYLKE